MKSETKKLEKNFIHFFVSLNIVNIYHNLPKKRTFFVMLDYLLGIAVFVWIAKHGLVLCDALRIAYVLLY